MEKPIEIFARLHIRHGPNTESEVQELAAGQNDITGQSSTSLIPT